MNTSFYLKHICLLSLLLFCSIVYAPLATASVSPQDLGQTIRILNRARTNGLEEFHAGTSSGKLSEREEKEFRTFLNYLGRRIYYYCTELEKTGTLAKSDDLPCYLTQSNTPQIPEDLPPPPLATATTSQEISQLDGSLNSALSQFDEMLLREQEQIAVQKSSAGQDRSQSPGLEGGSASSVGSKSNAGENSGRNQSANQTSQGGSVNEGAGVGNRNSKTTSAQNQPGVHDDDDIVARQLREAAEKETDPEIKEKLWEEYRKYKKGVN